MPAVPAASSKETAQSVAVLEDLIKNLNVSGSQDEVNAASGNIAALFSGPIPEQTLPSKYVVLSLPTKPTSPRFVWQQSTNQNFHYV